jgi:hypothetical protein
LLEIGLLLEIEGARTAIGELDSLMIAASLKPQEVKAKAALLGHSMAGIKHAITHNTLTVSDLESLRIGLLTLATSDQVNYFSYAFSVFLAVNHVNAALDDDLLPRRNIQRWFESVSQESKFDRQEFAMLADTLLRPVGRRLSIVSESNALKVENEVDIDEGQIKKSTETDHWRNESESTDSNEDELYGEESHNGEYIVVAGGFESVQNARKLVDELNLLGFEAHLSGFSPKGLNRVAYGAYKNRSEALKAMRWIQSTHNARAWMTTQ